MTLPIPMPTDTEKEELRPALQGTQVEPSWSSFLQKFWKDYKVEPTVWKSDGLEGGNLLGAVGGVHPTTVEKSVETPVVELPQRVRPLADQFVSFHPLQEWEGYVVGLGQDTFTARLTDLTAEETTANEEVDLPIDDLTDDDRKLLAPGRVFRWAIGYQRSVSGSKRRISQIVFRRLPQWTQKELDQAEEEGKRLSETLKWE